MLAGKVKKTSLDYFGELRKALRAKKRRERAAETNKFLKELDNKFKYPSGIGNFKESAAPELREPHEGAKLLERTVEIRTPEGATLLDVQRDMHWATTVVY